MKFKLPGLSIILIYIIPVPAHSTDMTNEIEYLLSFVEKTECQYVRNGKNHTGKEAVNHIKKKYNYFKDKITSAEDFIEFSATKSTMSGKYYMILCNNKQPLKSEVWLTRELEKYRDKYSKK